MTQARRRALLIAASAWLTGAFAAAPQPMKAFRVGVLFGSSRDAVASEMATFLGRLSELGYVEGRNLTVVARFASGDPARLPALAREVVDANVDVVFVPNVQGAIELQKLSQRINIIFIAGDPVKAGLVASLAHPGRNATGFTLGAPTIAAKRVELLTDAFPAITKLGVLVDRNFPVQEELAILSDAAQRLGVEVRTADAHTAEQYLEAVASLRAAHVNAYYVVYTGSAFAIRKELTTAIRDTRLPAIYGVTRFADDGGLIAYSWQTLKASLLAADYVDRVLRGARPADLPVQEPTVVELVVNLATARAQGLAIPRTLLQRADRTID